MLTKKEKETIAFCIIFTIVCCGIIGLCWVVAQSIQDITFPPSQYVFPPVMD